MIILASHSIYRRDFMSTLTDGFICMSSGYEERQHEGDTQDAMILARRHALGKARDVAMREPQAVVIGMDQTIEVDGKLLHKVAKSDQITMERDMIAVLMGMSGKTIMNCTGVAMLRPCLPEIVRVETTFVKVAPLSEAKVAEYVRLCWPADCVGCYRIKQVPHFFEDLPEDPSNLQGFPLKVVKELLSLL